MIPVIDTEGIFHALSYVFEKQYQNIEEKLKQCYEESPWSINTISIFPEVDDIRMCVDDNVIKELWKLDKLIESKIESQFRKIFNYCQADYFIGFIHGIGNYRRYIDPTYKANRKGKRPICLDRITKIGENRYKLYRVDNIEVDDAVIIAHNYYKEQGLDVVIVSPDKDLDQQEGKHLKIRKDSLEYFENTEEEANKILFKSNIIGDVADNCKGVEGIGEVGANKIIDAILEYPLPSSMRVLATYIGKYGELEGTHRFAKTFQLIYMLRKPERGFEVPKLIKLT